MPITNTEFWDKQIEVNTDGYGKAVVDVARRAMEILDEEPGAINCHKLLCRADDDIKAGGITGFMAGAAASVIGKVHSRGEEFRIAWNTDHGVSEEKAKGGTVNPAIINVGRKK